jgi:hypothetical protein
MREKNLKDYKAGLPERDTLTIKVCMAPSQPPTHLITPTPNGGKKKRKNLAQAPPPDQSSSYLFQKQVHHAAHYGRL